MRRILVVDDDPQIGRAIQGWLRNHGFHIRPGPVCPGLPRGFGARRCLRKPFKLAMLLDVIDQCLSQAVPHHRAGQRELTGAAQG